MTAVSRGLTLSLLLASLAAQSPTPPLFVEVEGLPPSCWWQQPIDLVVRIGYDAAWFASSSVPLFARQLDQPFHVVVPWLTSSDAHAVTLIEPRSPAPQRVAIGEQVLVMHKHGQRRVGERSYELLELRCRWLPLLASETTLAPVRVRYAFATKFEEDFLRGRQPLDRQEATVTSAALAVQVKALPVPAPALFAGAVGEFSLRASTAAKSVVVGQPFVLLVEVTGFGNLVQWPPLAPKQLAGFHVQGVVERSSPGTRRFEVELLPLRAQLTAVPPLAFVAFSPRANGYVTLTSEPVPVRIEPLATGAQLPLRVQELLAAEAQLVALASAPSWWWSVAAAFLVLLGTLGLRTRRRGLAHAQALATAKSRLASSKDAIGSLATFEAALAAVAAVPAWSHAGWASLAARGVTAAAVATARALHTQLDAARFGGAVPAASELAAALDALSNARR